MPKIKRKRQKKEQELKRKGIKENTKYQISFLVILVFILYGNTLYNKYSLDDSFVVLNHKKVEKGIKGIPEIFTSRYIESESEINMTTGYRPIVISTFAIEYEFFGYAPGTSHFINIILYALAVVFLFFILKRIFKNYHYLFPILITILFIAHPVHTEVVASLKNRDELLALGGALFSMLQFLKYASINKYKFLLSGLFFFFFAYLSKPTALPYIVLIPLVLFFFTNLNFKKILLIGLSLLGIFIAIKYVPQFYLPEGYRPRLFYENNILYEDYFTRLTTGFYILFFYLKKLLIPFPLLYYYGYNMIPVVGIDNPWVILSILIHLFIFGFAIYKIKQKQICSFIILFYLIAIVPYTNVVKPIMGMVGERFLLTPSIAFSIFLVFILFLALKVNPTQNKHMTPTLNKILIVVFIILIPYSAITINRNTKWKDSLTLYESDMKYLENSVKANELYASRLFANLEAGDFIPAKREELTETILAHYIQSLKLFPEYHKVWNNIAILYSHLGQPDKSIQYLKKAIELKPNMYLYHFNLGARYHQIKKYEEAIKCFKECIKIDPSYIEAHYFLSTIYLKQKELELARLVNHEIIKYDSSAYQPNKTLGYIYIQLGDTLKSIQHWETAVQKNPNNADICRRLSGYYLGTGDTETSKYYKNLAMRATQ